MAYEVFVNALHSRYLKQSLVIPDLEDHNPAGNCVYTQQKGKGHFNPAWVSSVASVQKYSPHAFHSLRYLISYHVGN